MGNNKKRILGGVFAVTAIMSVLLMLVAFTGEKVIELKLKGDKYQIIEVFSEYEEQSFELFLNDELLEDSEDYVVSVDSSDVNTEKVGVYYVKYDIEDHPDKSVIRTVGVVDTTAPELKLKGSDVKVIETKEYKESGFTAIDNYDGDISENVKIMGKVDTKVKGDYELIYEIVDSSDNYTSVKRKVSVIEDPNKPIVKPIKKPETIKPKDSVADKVVDDNENKKDEVKKEEIVYANEMKDMKYSGNNISFSGVSDTVITSVGLLAEGAEELTLELATKHDGKSYSFNLDVNNIPDGTYTLVAANLDNTPILENNKGKDRLGNATVAGRNVSISYPNNRIVIKVSPRTYTYDVAIQVGHGADDNGASGNGYIEKELNLMVSLYEKARFEQLGMRVYISRTSNNTYGEVSGDTSLKRLTRAAIRFGEVAAQSRSAYSNHHNSAGNGTSNGWQIIIANQATAKDLAIEHAVARAWNDVHPTRKGIMYGRDYQNGTIHNKIGGAVNNDRNFYAMIREPFERNKVYTAIYEMAFVSNKSEITDYMSNGKWMEVAEAKIKAYAEGLGYTYWPPTIESDVEDN